MLSEYQAASQKLFNLGNLEKPLKWRSKAELQASLARMKTFLKVLGNPHLGLKYVHVTGTSGKGSVTNYVKNILLSSGATVGSYSSPHTTTLLERFAVNQRLANPKVLVSAVNTVAALYEDYLRQGHRPLSYFQLTFAVACQIFKLAKVKWAVIEVGMGGEYDATNAIPAPAVAVITNIDLDHTEFLGKTKKQIAKTKAGIIKPGCMVVTGETETEPLAVIKAAAKKTKSPLTVVPKPSSNHQEHNRAITQAVGLYLNISPPDISRGLATAIELPCRFEKISQRPVVILDGGHNPAKIAATVATWKKQGYPKAQLIFGCKGNKDVVAMVKKLNAITHSVITTRYTAGHGQPSNPAELLKLFPKAKQLQCYLDPFTALTWALKHTPKNRPILITGSLYLSGQLRAHWRSETAIVSQQKS